MLSDKQGEVRPPLLSIKSITKSFGATLANNCINLEIIQGEVHALLGENGAGKTTLMNIIYGLYRPDSGEILINGNSVEINSPRDAIFHKIGMVHQHFMLIPNLTVVENVILGLPITNEPFLDIKQEAEKVKQVAESYGLNIDPHALVSDLPVGVQQRVEILKTLYRGAELLILDEPTAVLSPTEVDDFFNVLKNLVKEGLSIIFISHKLDEVLNISDRITVLRNGVNVGTIYVKDATKAILTEMMVGREVLLQVKRESTNPGAIVLEVKGLSAEGDSGNPVVKDINLSVRSGEIMGIAGVDGNGQQEFAEVLTGLRPSTSGKIILNGNELTNCPPAQFIENNIAFIPADRQQVGLVMDFSIDENLAIKDIDKPNVSRRGIINRTEMRRAALNIIDEYDIRAQNERVTVKHLSGGNQQKVILAREIESQPQLLIAMHPTRGLDVGAMEFVQRRIMEQKTQGVAVILISTELEEILSLADKVAVLFRGEVMGCLPIGAVTIDQIGHMMLGERITVLESESPE